MNHDTYIAVFTEDGGISVAAVTTNTKKMNKKYLRGLPLNKRVFLPFYTERIVNESNSHLARFNLS